jgi:UDP-N-acetylglucosamine 2-epimerase
MSNPYGDGHASKAIIEVLTNAPLGVKLLMKRSLP